MNFIRLHLFRPSPLLVAILLIVAWLLLSATLAFAQEPTGPKKPTKPKPILISAEDSNTADSLYLSIIMAEQAKANAEQTVEAAKARLEAFKQKLGRIYGFDPDKVDYKKQKDSTTLVTVRKEEKPAVAANKPPNKPPAAVAPTPAIEEPAEETEE